MVIRVTGDTHPNASDSKVLLDAFKIKEVTEETVPGVKYAKWNGKENDSATDGVYRASKTRGARSWWTFEGTRIDWITARVLFYGKAVVCIDGIRQGTYDLYAPVQE